MKKVLFLVANGMAGFLDITVGAFIAFAVGKLFGIAIPWWYLLVGSVLGCLPDLDLLWTMVGKKNGKDHHLTLLHRPTVMFPVVIGLATFFGMYWTIVAGMCLLWHYLHDSPFLSMVGSGIDWTWPLTNKVFPYAEHEEWIEMYWLRPSKQSVLELGAGIVLVWVLVSHYSGYLAASVSAGILFLGTLSVWACDAATDLWDYFTGDEA